MACTLLITAIFYQFVRLSSTLPANSITLTSIGAAIEPVQVKQDLNTNSPSPIDNDRARFDKDYFTDRKNQYSVAQKLLINAFQPKPVVDTITENEKYGNEGETFAKIGRGVVDGLDSVSSLIRTAVGYPFQVVGNFSRKATETLDQIGGKLVGL